MAPSHYQIPLGNAPFPPSALPGISVECLPKWLELATPFVDAILQQARLDAREECKRLLEEKAEAAAEADRNEEIDTVRSAAAILKVREQTIYELFKSGKLAGYKVGRAVRFKRGEVLAVLKAQTLPDGRRKYARRAATNKKSR